LPGHDERYKLCNITKKAPRINGALFKYIQL
jgi:hypothetical protein